MSWFFTSISDAIFPSEWRPYHPYEPSPYNLETYRGRVAHFYKILDPRTLFIEQQQLDRAAAVLENYHKTTGKVKPSVNAELWEARLLRESVLHPDTQKPIYWACRFSAFPAINVPICTLLLYPGSVSMTVFSQFINQTYNVAVNYANRNATNAMSNQKLFASYICAVTASCGIGFGLRQMTKNYNLATNIFLRSFIPYTALTLASCFNLYFIRWNEVTEGIELKIKFNDSAIDDQTGDFEWKEVGKSRRAGHVALMKCCVARMVWSVPPLFFPPLIMRGLFLRRAWFARMKQWQKMCIESSVIGAVLLTFIPPSLALFPQRDSITNRWLEDEFKQKYDPATKFYFNKGL